MGLQAKANQDVTIVQHKARLVAQGFFKGIGMDHDDTFYPVASMTIILTLIGLKALNCIVRKLDVDTAYLNADLDMAWTLT